MEIIIMAQLSSPGVSVEVSDESFYTSSAPGTVPLIFIATAANKLNSAKTGLAPGTVKTSKKYGQVFKITSSKELTDTFGQPVFKTDASNTPVNAGEQNEYGLHAAYSYMGVSSAAYVVRADVDLDQLKPLSAEPAGVPANNTFWLNTIATHWGMAAWNSDPLSTASGQKFSTITPTVITNTAHVDLFTSNYAPLQSFGSTGTYAISAVSSLISYWYKSSTASLGAGNWVLVGSPEWKGSIPTIQGNNTVVGANTFSNSGADSDSLQINGHAVTGFTSLDTLVTAINAVGTITDAGIKAANVGSTLVIYSTGEDVNLVNSTAATLETLGISIANATKYIAPLLTISSSTSVPTYKRKDADNVDTVIGAPTGSLWIKSNSVNGGSNWVIQKYETASSTWITKSAPLYANGAAALHGIDSTGGGINIAGNSVYVKFNDSETAVPVATFKVYRRKDVSATSITSATITSDKIASGSYTIDIQESVISSAMLSTSEELVFEIPTFISNTTEAEKVTLIIDAIMQPINARLNTAVSAVRVGNRITISHEHGGDIEFNDVNGLLLSLFSVTATANFYHHASSQLAGNTTKYIATLWSEHGATNDVSFITASNTVLTGGAVDGLLWYSANIDDVDIMVNHNKKWKAYRSVDHGTGPARTDPKGPIVSASKPTTQQDGITNLVDGDLWVDTSDLENYPALYKYINFEKKWEKVDITDQVTEHGIVFADARWSTSGSASTPAAITALLGGNLDDFSQAELDAADFVDFDAPDPALYPNGMLLWNLRRSGYNVKKLHKDYVNTNALNVRFSSETMADYYPHRWVSEAANLANGAGAFGRMAQRGVVVQALQALVNSNQQIRETEVREFNLIACPGYPELVGEMKILNYDNGITAFVIADTPARLTPDATSLENWGSNVAGAIEDNDKGLTTADPYLAFFYPWGLSSDNSGNNIVIPPSAMMLRTIALNDASSHLWFAPAGTSRGVINNATSVGYVNTSGEFVTVALNLGQRNTLAKVKVNPLTSIVGSGVVNMGQFTRSSVTSSLDRINVARLIVQLRRQFAKLVRPYLFQPNDSSTRNQIKYAAESMLIDLVGQRALYDFAVVCDTSNNTPTRIDNGEVYLDVAIEPTKAVEFIYIPLRLLNTGEVKTLGAR
jgi:hypothetical protein